VRAADRAVLHGRILSWYAANARSLPWRDPACSPWGVLVSEIMAQQTPLARVEPAWREWMRRWPTPAALAAESPGEVVRAWGRLGYPRRALRLREAALAIVERHEGEVPEAGDDLRALPGVGAYTAAAVRAFAFGGRATVVDTNVRRVQARIVTGVAQAAPSLTRAESDLATALLPEDDGDAATWNVAVMELGALVCTARSPRCDGCPVSDRCAWLGAGAPAYDGPVRPSQRYAGTDRQVRGDLIQVLRESSRAVPIVRLERVDPDPARVDRLLAALVEEGLVEPVRGGRYRLPRWAPEPEMPARRGASMRFNAGMPCASLTPLTPVRTPEELKAHLAVIAAAPRDAGTLTMVVARPGTEQREVLDEGELDLAVGLVGDNWAQRPSSRTADGKAHPDMQLNVINHRIVQFLSFGDAQRQALAGDQLHVDLDLSHDNLPPGTRLTIGDPGEGRGAVIEVTEQPHTGCKKFVARYGPEAMRFVNGQVGRPLRLRGLNAKVVVPGRIRPGDKVTVTRP
jgi:A/G-specific adenine glycosylase